MILCPQYYPPGNNTTLYLIILHVYIAILNVSSKTSSLFGHHQITVLSHDSRSHHLYASDRKPVHDAFGHGEHPTPYLNFNDNALVQDKSMQSEPFATINDAFPLLAETFLMPHACFGTTSFWSPRFASSQALVQASLVTLPAFARSKHFASSREAYAATEGIDLEPYT